MPTLMEVPAQEVVEPTGLVQESVVDEVVPVREEQKGRVAAGVQNLVRFLTDSHELRLGLSEHFEHAKKRNDLRKVPDVYTQRY